MRAPRLTPPIAWGAVAGALALFVALGPLGGLAHVTDEVAYTLQARLFAAGMRTGPATDVPSMLDYPFWVSAPASYSPFPPGWPALLSLGEVVGAPWVVNPLLVALLPGLVWLAAREWVDERTAGVAAAVAAVSPQVLLLGGSRMAHMSVVVALGVALAVVVRRRDPPWAWTLAGLAVGFVVVTRPFDAALLGGPLLLLGLARAPGWGARAPLVVLPGLAAATLLADNAALTGDPLVFPMSAWLEAWSPGARAGCNALGFGPDIGCFDAYGEPGHSPRKALRIAAETAQRLDRLLLGLPGGMLLGVAGLAWLRRAEPLALVALVAGGHLFYWSPGLAYGARFWAPMLLVLPIGVAVVAARLPRWAPHAVVVAIGLAGGSRLLPELGDGYRCVDAAATEVLSEAGITDGVVLVDARGTRAAAWPIIEGGASECEPMLEAGALFQHLDPTSPRGGLQVRHALSDPAQIPLFLDRHHPGAPAWMLQHDVAADAYRLLPIRGAGEDAAPGVRQPSGGP